MMTQEPQILGNGDTARRRLSLESLPDELLQLVVAYLSTQALKNTSLVSKTLHRHATDFLWQNVCLVDQWTLHTNEETDQLWTERGNGESDEHDDTPIIQRLYILATNPVIASKVQTVTHRCHLPSPNIFTELPRMHFDGITLSRDTRTHILLASAIANLVNVHTLRIVGGHMKLTNALVAGFLDHERPQRVPLRRLWLESCCLWPNTLQHLSTTSPIELESIRLRRLDFVSAETMQRRKMGFLDFRYSRGGQSYPVHNGAGKFVDTTVQLSEEGLPESWPRYSTEELVEKAQAFDSAIWEGLPGIRMEVDAGGTRTVDTRERIDAPIPLQCLLEHCTSSLTSLNLDWILWRRKELDPYDDSITIIGALTALRFPHLRALQVRNAVLPLTKLPEDAYLLEGPFLGFLEGHPKIQCLAWPIDKIYKHHRPSIDLQNRSRKLVAHLANMLTDLRIDAEYLGHGEPFTDMSQTTDKFHERIRRRRFIAEFAPFMRNLEQIKLEGGIPRDEKREILRALHWCPLRKVVMIGVSFPVGNLWGHQGAVLKDLDPGQGSDAIYDLKDEDLPGILQAYRQGSHMPEDFHFEPNYGWPKVEPPLLQNISLHHADTVEELKICGYHGCPILSDPTQATDPLLNSLRQFHNLKQLVMSFWLLTWFEDSYRDTEIIQSWLDARSPSSTALAIVTPPQSPTREFAVDPGQFPNLNAHVAPRQDFNRWAVLMKTRFTPSALAYRVARDIGPYLSPVAKNRSGGVRVRGSFCLGIRGERRAANDIFDLDMWIGKDDQVLEFIGPREEGEKRRWWEKLESRRWF